MRSSETAGRQIPRAGQLFRSDAGVVWRVVDVDADGRTLRYRYERGSRRHDPYLTGCGPWSLRTTEFLAYCEEVKR